MNSFLEQNLKREGSQLTKLSPHLAFLWSSSRFSSLLSVSIHVEAHKEKCVRATTQRRIKLTTISQNREWSLFNFIRLCFVIIFMCFWVINLLTHTTLTSTRLRFKHHIMVKFLTHFVCFHIFIASTWVTKLFQLRGIYSRSSFSLMDFSIDARYFILIRNVLAASKFPDSWSDEKSTESWADSSRRWTRIVERSSLVDAFSTWDEKRFKIIMLITRFVCLPLRSSPSFPLETLDHLLCCSLAEWGREVSINILLVQAATEVSCTLCW